MAVTVNQATAAPTRKMRFAGLGGALTVLVLALVEGFTNVPVSSEVASALTLVMTILVGYITKEEV